MLFFSGETWQFLKFIIILSKAFSKTSDLKILNIRVYTIASNLSQNIDLSTAIAPSGISH